jgi:DNA repair exonuclease SbcCD nuclease subunit
MVTQLKCSVKNFTHIVHVGDIHIRLTQRHEEYTTIFDKFYEEVEKTPDTTAIAILGDLFHNKSDLSPECVDSAQDFLCKCSELRPTVLIAGNHDATLTNKNRVDSLTPIVKALKHKHLFYLKDNGLYALGDILFNNMSIFSSPLEYITYDKIPRVYKNKYLHHIALYHGPVNGVLTDLGFYMVNKAMPVEIFDGHHIALLGDIHRKQDLQYFDNAKSKPYVHYCGSFIQQNHSETMEGHGFSL